MSKIFACSDTHFGHHNIIRYCGRPFKNTATMNETLIKTWNERVSVIDTVYFLGDFAMGPKVDSAFIRETLIALNGHMRVVLGNHDQPNKKYKQEGLRKLAKAFTDIEILSDIHEEQIDGQTFIMCHYPMSDWDGAFHGSVHLHGHQHNRFDSDYFRSRTERMKTRFDVGVDMYGGPVQITGDLRYLNNPKGWSQ
jgi:calcineurin-like phosphoesterase family protein